MYGSAPIMPTMWSLRSMTDSSSVGAATQRLDPAFRESPLQVLLVLLRVDDRQLEVQILLARDLLDDLHHPGQVEIAAAVPAEPTSSGMRFCRAPSRANLMSRFTAARENEHSPVPRLANPLSVEAGIDADEIRSQASAVSSVLVR